MPACVLRGQICFLVEHFEIKRLESLKQYFIILQSF